MVGEFDEPLPLSLCQSIVDCIMREKGKCEGDSTIPGLGNKYPSVKKLLYAISSVHHQLCQPSPTTSAALMSKVNKWKKAHLTNHHRGFDAHLGLIQIFTAIQTMPGWSEMLRLQVMAMSLYCFHHGHRPDSECGQYCLDVSDISLPKFKQAFDKEGLPKWINVACRVHFLLIVVVAVVAPSPSPSRDEEAVTTLLVSRLAAVVSRLAAVRRGRQ
jgi:hypothetical protein